MIYLDTETTGLDPDFNEVLEIAIVDREGKILLNTLVKPQRNESWHEAQVIHGISPEMVANAPTMEDLKPTINDIVKGQHVRIYNKEFDAAFVDLSAAEKTSCVMRDMAKFNGYWNNWHCDYRLLRLSEAASKMSLSWDGTAHRALADTQMTRLVDNAMSEFVTDGDYLEGGKRWRVEQDLMRQVERVWRRYDQEQATIHHMTKCEETRFLERLGIHKKVERYESPQLMSDFYANLFFGKTIAQIKDEDWRDEKQARFGDRYYTRNKDIPNSLISESKVKAMCSYNYVFKLLFNKFEPAGILVTPKTWRYLYDASDVKRVIESDHTAQLYLRPRGYTLTELRKMGYKDDEILAQKQTGIRSSNYGNSWSLYPIPTKK
ncbi:3'-5' exonuclease [Photobacterium leiognathi]|uniref:3'-5' exonuclease n=1 Tax=Photobacterium leiognathi TaxID=553611 RepID=UPI0002088DE1|nr:3'-5' exonuclease [Photobacterium leiognathi]PSW47837.1 3'-5' exonuclease [Photobacterium leiognathi subsp. mandapamensis]GAA06975.1 exonuclease family protein [Photobacterium leiognathi subsp. mandapamensis svers.1.1.]